MNQPPPEHALPPSGVVVAPAVRAPDSGASRGTWARWFARWEEATEHHLARIPSGRLALWLALAGVTLCVLAYSPRFENWSRGYPYSWETFRGAGFLMQCQDPFRSDVEPALRWRLLPPLLCHLLGLRGAAALLLPWTGVIALLAVSAWLLLGRGVTRVATAASVLLLSTTSAVIISVGWLGMNDAWVWCGLVVLVLGRDWRSRTVWALLGPWIDERLLIGLPLAILLHAKLDGSASWATVLQRNRSVLVAATLYATARLCALAFSPRDPSGGFLHWTLLHLHEWLPNVAHGWWHGLRAAWVLVALALFAPALTRPRGFNVVLLLLAGSTAGAMALLAADLSRSAAILAPAAVAGVVLCSRLHPRLGAGLVGTLVLVNLLLPAATVIGPYTLWLENFAQHNLVPR